jgi:hypothetical protein
VSIGRDHGRPVGKDNGTRWSSRIRWAQARERTQAPHSRCYPRLPDRESCGARQHIGPACWRPATRRFGSTVSANSDRDGLCGHESKKLARELFRDNGWTLQIVKRRERAFRITGLMWIVERTFACNRRLSKDYEYAVQTSETMIDVATIRLMLNRLTAS